MFETFHIQCIGANHIENDMICQDAVSSVTKDSYYLAVVADGHGGSDYVRSDRGSRYAVEAVQECIDEFLHHRDYFEESLADNYPKLLRHLGRSIVASWNEKVSHDVSIEPFSEEELVRVSDKAKQRYLSGQKVEQAYGTTLIASVITDKYWFGLHQGDGKCIAVSCDGTFYEPIPWDDRCYQNICTSMCDSDVGNSMRYYFSKEIPLAVFVASDGIDDSFAYDIDMYCFYMKMLGSFNGEHFSQMCADWQNKLSDISKRGSGDDMSIAGIVDRERLPDVLGKFQDEIKQREDYLVQEKQALDEKKKKWLEQLKNAKNARPSVSDNSGSLSSIVVKIHDAIVGTSESSMGQGSNEKKDTSINGLFEVSGYQDDVPVATDTNHNNDCSDESNLLQESDDAVRILSKDTSNVKESEVALSEEVQLNSFDTKNDDDLINALSGEIESEFRMLVARALPVIRNATQSSQEAECILLDTIRGLLSKENPF